MAVVTGSAEIAVILVNWNGRHHLERCLPALAAQTGVAFETVLVDNGSTDGSAAWVRSTWPDIRLVESSTNLGFAAGNNLALELTTTPLVALLNTDTIPPPGWLASLRGAIDGAAGITASALGSVCALMVFADCPDMVNSAGIAVDPAGIAWDMWGGRPLAAVGDPVEVFGAHGGASLFRRKALEDVADLTRDGRSEVFDSTYFMYLEDVDLAWRLRLRGWRSAVVTAVPVRHVQSGSSGEGSPFKNRLLGRNKVWTLLKDYPAWPGLVRSPLIVAYDLASAPYRVVAQGQTSALAGRWDAVRHPGEALFRRRRIQARRRVSGAELARTMEGWTVPWNVPARYAHLAGRGLSGDRMRAIDPINE
jgi:GT2 family glycosyltransferase